MATQKLHKGTSHMREDTQTRPLPRQTLCVLLAFNRRQQSLIPMCKTKKPAKEHTETNKHIEKHSQSKTVRHNERRISDILQW